MFSSRLPENLTPNALASVVTMHRAAGRPLFDLTVTNPTVCGIEYPESILSPLASAAALTYDPSPFGRADARDAVARDYARRGADVPADRIVLTSSTSEAYSLLFKLLCDPGDVVLVPTPSYPLFELLSRMDAVSTVPYRLEYHGRWMVDRHSLEHAPPARAVLAVSPNNPTGSVLSADDEAMLNAWCLENGAALIVDEVFADYPWVPGTQGPEDPRTQGPEGSGGVLTFRLGGLSKSAGLPQVKLGWIALDGPETIACEALQRLEIICDTYLSVSTPVQLAAPELIERGASVRATIQRRIVRNLEMLSSMLRDHPGTELLNGDGGWSVVLRVPSTISEEQLILDLLEKDDVLVHPGFFFDFPHEAFVVLSLLTPPAVFDEGVRRVLDRVHA